MSKPLPLECVPKSFIDQFELNKWYSRKEIMEENIFTAYNTIVDYLTSMRVHGILEYNPEQDKDFRRIK